MTLLGMWNHAEHEDPKTKYKYDGTATRQKSLQLEGGKPGH